MADKEKFASLIQTNIENHEYHLTTVIGNTEPRYVYSIGLNNLFGFELVFAGGTYYLYDDVFKIFEGIIKELKNRKDALKQQIIIESLGAFSLSNVDESWGKLMLLGAFDYYQTKHINAFQINPDATHFTHDIPNMSKKLNILSEPIWQWLVREWDYGVPADSTVITNINALLGEPITEVVRCEINEWEMFAGNGPELDSKDMRVLPLGTMIGIDKSLLPTINLPVGKGLRRDSSLDSDWNNWD
jgi:hypothetical protein